MNIKLSNTEILSAALVGIMRQVSSIKHGRSNSHGYGGESEWQIHVEGALAEAAVAKALDIFWMGQPGHFPAQDVGDFQVRSTDFKSGHLIVRDHDKSEDVFILVIGKNGRYKLVGWMIGREAKQPQYNKVPQEGRPPCYFVPQDKLHPMHLLGDQNDNTPTVE